MSKRYKDEMSKIHIDEEMKKRILYNVLNSSNIEVKNTKLKRERYIINRKHMQFSVACLVLILCTSVLKTYPDVLRVNDSGTTIESENFHSNSEDEDYYDNKLDRNTELNDSLSSNSKTRIGDNKENVKSVKDDNKEVDINLKSDNKSISNSNGRVNKDAMDKENLIEPKSSDNENISNSVDEENERNDSNINNKKSKLVNPEDNLESTIEDSIRNNNVNKLQEHVESDSGISEASFYRERAINSIVQYKRIEDAESECGININVSENIGYNFKIKNINVINNEILEVIYQNDNNNLVFRASKTAQDINYDYNSYEYSGVLNQDNISITLKGDDRNSIKLVLWNKDEILYSLFMNNSIRDEEVNNILKKMI